MTGTLLAITPTQLHLFGQFESHDMTLRDDVANLKPSHADCQFDMEVK
jgi:hypothetical protein